MSKVINLLNLHKSNPIYQAFSVALATLIIMGITSVGKDTTNNDGWENVWVIAITFLLFFSIFNTVMSLGVENQTTYFWKSITCFFGLMAFSIGAAYLLSGVSIYEAGVFRWMLVVVFFGYLVFFSIVMAIQGIVNYAQKQDKKFRNEE